MKRSSLFVGSTYKAAMNLEDGINFVDSFNPDVVLLDIHFPKSTRHDSMQAAKLLDGKCPVVILTGDPSDANRLEFTKAGASGFIDKNSHMDLTLNESAKFMFDQILSAIAIWKARHDR